MRVPLSWLREWVEWNDDAAALAEALTRRGLEIDAVERPGRGAAGIVAATIVAAQKHPASDRLHVCRVRAGARLGAVVSGAPNARPGLLTAWATPGATLPGGRKIGARAFRGETSEGMLCAPDELGLPGGHQGLIELRGLAEGQDLTSALELDEPVLVLELTPNYAAHCQCVLGVAREVAAVTGGALRHPPAEPREQAGEAGEAATVRIADADLCPRYVARVFDVAERGRAPLWMARRLEVCGMRSIDGIVDVTNYVMLEMGQPLHAFDLDRLVGGGVVARRAAPGEDIVTLDGRRRALEADDLVIADAAGPVAVAGVMGGQRAEVSAATRRVLLESAAFAADGVARTARRLGIPSEASARFGRGVDPALPPRAADRAAFLLAEHVGAVVHPGTVQAGPGVEERWVGLRGRRVRDLLGVRLSTAACGRHLESFGFRVAADGADRLRVLVPSWRPDVREEVDLVEEVARSYGYDRLPAQIPPGDPGVPLPDPERPVRDKAREIALAAGYSEVQPYSYHGAELWDAMRLPADHPWRRATALENPMDADQAYLRTTLAGGLLRTLSLNARLRRTDAAVFEIGRAFRPPRPRARPAEPVLLGAAGYGALRPADWTHPAEACDFWAGKGLLAEVLARTGCDAAGLDWEPAPEAHPTLHPGRCAEVRWGGRTLGWIGEVHPEVRAAFDLPDPAFLAELDLGAVADAAGNAVPTFRPLPRHPSARRDLALAAPDALTAAEVEAAIRAAGGPLLVDVRLFDVYTGAAVGPGRRSLAYALSYQAGDRTLTDAEVAERHDLVRSAVAALPGVELR